MVGRLELLLHSALNNFHFSLRLFAADARLQPRPDAQVLRVAPRHACRAEFLSERNPELIGLRQSGCIAIQIKANRHHTHNGTRRSIHGDGASDDSRIAIESALPKMVAQ